MTKLFIYNYGITEVATFKAKPDAYQCMQAFNDNIIKSHGLLPERIFYYTLTRVKGKNEIFVMCSQVVTDSSLSDSMKRKDFINNLIK